MNRKIKSCWNFDITLSHNSLKLHFYIFVCTSTYVLYVLYVHMLYTLHITKKISNNATLSTMFQESRISGAIFFLI